MTEQIGQEDTPDAFVARLTEVFREVRRVLAEDGTLWLNIGDSYAANRGYQVPSTLMNGDATNEAQAGTGRGMKAATMGMKPKDLMGIPWMLAFALRADGWYLRQDIIWHKPNPMPESVRDRCTKAHEYVFLMSKSERYFYDSDAIAEASGWPDGPGNVRPNRAVPGHGVEGENGHTRGSLHKIGPRDTRNKRSVWSIATQPYAGAHFATMAPELAETCIKAGCPDGGTVLDPFGGAGTTGLVADRLQRNAVLVELNPAYIDIARRRITGDSPLFADVNA